MNLHGAQPASARLMLDMTAFSDIIEQHATDAAFLWLLHSFSESSAFYSIDDIAELDQRIVGHLEGLISAEQTGWDICLRNFKYEESGESFVAAFIAFHSGDDVKINMVCEKALDSAEMTAGLVSALGWLNESKANLLIKRFLNPADLKYLYLGIAACSKRRFDPNQQLDHILQDANITHQPELYARCLRLIGEIKRHDLVPALNQAMDTKHEIVRFWANWSAALLGNRTAINQLKPYVLEDNPHKDHALELVFNVLPLEQARQLITGMSKDPSQTRTVINAIAILGDTDHVTSLIQQMSQPLFARQAGLSFSLITGVDLEQYQLDKEIGTTFKDDAEGIEDDAENPDHGLPWPDQNKVQNFWVDYSESLEPGQRYFMGRSVTSESLRQVLCDGNQMQRSAAAFKLAMLELDSVLQNVAAPSVII